MERDFHNHIGYYAQEIARQLTWVHNETLKSHGITFAQFRVLNCLWKQDGQTFTQLVETLKVKPSTITGIVRILMSKGLLLRTTDPDDNRSRRLNLTPEGQILKQDSWKIILDLESQLSSGFTSTEKALMLQWLSQVLNNIQTEAKTLDSVHMD